MTELLAPAGNIEAFKTAIANGCDAVYLGMQKFGARAYSDNFDIDTLKEAIEYAHLRDVKVFVTMNTIVFEEEMEDMKKQLHKLNEIGADAVIVQDLAVFEYAKSHFEDMEVHCSTQMGIDDLEGTLLCKELGSDRVVLAREVSMDKVKGIRKEAQLPIEIFVHGALCVSYSGNCLMSGLIGYRSGKRGRCVGSCRKPYELIDTTTGKSLGTSYILSTKDLNTIDHIEDLKAADSLKIEGRMKEPVYVANVVSKYRAALDGTATDEDKKNLNKTFNRTYTEGYLFGEDPGNITNISRPNNFGYPIGRIAGQYRGMYEIALDQNEPLNQNDIIRIDHDGEDVNLSVVRLYDRAGDLINSADDTCYIKIKENLSPGDEVYKTKDYLYYKDLESAPAGEFRRFPLDFKVYAYPGSKLVIDAEGFGIQHMYEGEEVLGEAINNPTTKEQVIKQLSRLNDTVFELGQVEFDEYNAFVPAKMLNNARREIVQALYDKKLSEKQNREKAPLPKENITFEKKQPYLTASVTTKEQYDACIEAGIKDVYFENIVRRNQIKYEKREGELLLGGYGGIYAYRDTNPFITDYSLNVVNSSSTYQLHRLGAKRVTLSYELNKNQIKELIDTYHEENGGYPALEMIVYGRAPLLVTKYCPLKKMGQCGKCQNHRFEIEDEYGTFPILSDADLANDNCLTTILNGKILNLLDEMPYIEGVEAFRINFTIETAGEVKRIIRAAQGKLDAAAGRNTKAASAADTTLFNQETDTRGHFNKEIM
ncbi:MAG: U32 family peptidase [Firmicutes bacterium]|nr:U32 family peptidase [Bacillota bacterium]